MKRLSLVAALTALSICVLFGAPSASATSKSQTETKKKTAVIVTVKIGDTLSAIATKYKTTYVRIFNANEKITNPDLIDVGDKIRIPAKSEKLPDRFGKLVVATPTQSVSSPAPSSSATQQTVAPSNYNYAPTGSSAGNTYYYGYCTWYAKQRRPDLPNMLGNGGQWTANAAARGYSTGTVARPGAIAEAPGHVMYVESVSADGRSMVISEMNGTAGWNQIDSRTLPTSGHTFIY